MTKPPRRKQLGRPKKDFTTDPDLIIVELATALQRAWGMSQRAAIDLALAMLEGEPGAPSKVPRKRRPGTVVGYRLQATVGGRNATIRRKMKFANKDVVPVFVTMLIPKK